MGFVLHCPVSLACPLFYDDCRSFNLADKLIATLCGPASVATKDARLTVLIMQRSFVTLMSNLCNTFVFCCFQCCNSIRPHSGHSLWKFLAPFEIPFRLAHHFSIFSPADASFFLPLSKRKSNDSQGQRKYNKKGNKWRKGDARLCDNFPTARFY